jgi:hypothetical protein
VLSDFWSFWFDVMQSVGSIATAIALAFVAYQSFLSRKQVTLVENEMDINLRPRLYREKYSDGQEFHLENGRILIMLKNSGKLAPTHVEASYSK